MKIVISPAKSLNMESVYPNLEQTEARFLEKSAEIMEVLREKSPNELSALMKISDKLSMLNWERNQAWQMPFDAASARAAIYSFDGDVYAGLDAYSLGKDEILKLQSDLRILSGLYGILRPLDRILAYRLEMGTKLAIGKSANLYGFWKETLTDSLNDELEEGELFVNLASTEYFSVLDTKRLKVPVITPEFRDYKDGKLKMISFFAKKARGMMVRYLVEKSITDLEGIKAFDYGGYRFDEGLSKGNTLVFTR